MIPGVMLKDGLLVEVIVGCLKIISDFPLPPYIKNLHGL
jgi:hypothetical protein